MNAAPIGGLEAGGVMHRPPVMATPAARLAAARGSMLHHDLPLLAVVDDALRPLGVVSELPSGPSLLYAETVADVMRPAPVAGTWEALEVVLARMADAEVSCALVVDTSGQVQGVITRRELLELQQAAWLPLDAMESLE